MSSVEQKTLRAHKYELEEKIGSGSFGHVYKVLHTKTKEPFALKLIQKSKLTTKAEESRFQRELDTMAYLDNENLVKMHDFFSDSTNFYLIVDFCQGGELFNYIVTQQKLNEPIAAVIFKQIVSAIAYCHSYGVAHRDLKPENILITEFPTIKVTDFGLCGYFDEHKLMSTFCGSPCYCAPECLSRVQYDGRLSDIWSLGVILYAMVTGEHPWTVSNTSQMLRQIIQAKYTIPSFLTDECRDLISRLLVAKPTDRIEMKDIIAHPWLKFSEWALVARDKTKLLDLTLSQMRLLQPLTLNEAVSNSSSRSSKMSDHGIFSPFDDTFEDLDEEPISLQDLKVPSMPNLVGISSSLDKFKSIVGSTTSILNMKSKKRIIVRPNISRPNSMMSVIKEIE